MFYLYHVKNYHYILIFLLISTQAIAQVCTGNLGENLFPEGDFGSGTANIPPTDPMIAPGYIYTTNPPPFDGFYTITNNTWSWTGLFTTWLTIEDNSPDPNGYMMVVNASFDPGLFYEQQVDNLCENTLYSFSADIINLIRPNVNQLLPNVSFLIDGAEQYSTGNIPESGQWTTYGFTFTTAPGQTSVTLSLRNNAPGGIGNDIALDNISFRPCGPEAFALIDASSGICAGGMPIDITANIIGNQYDTPVYQWQQSFDGGMTWVDIPGANAATYTHTDVTAGTYYYRYLLANASDNLLNISCRVISDVEIIEIPPAVYSITDTLCQGLSFPLGDNLYSTTGIYTENLTTANGCDSIVTLDLTIIPDTQIEAEFILENPSCSYLQDGSLVLDTITGGVPPFEVYIDGELDVDQAVFNLGGGDYAYQIEDHYGCTSEDILTLVTPIPFIADLGQDITVELGEVVVLSPIFMLFPESISWSPAAEINCEPDCTTPIFIPANSLTVTLNATSTMGCVTSDSIRINVEAVRKVFIPNVFSPNDDGANDTFTIFGGIPDVQEIELLNIYDRWGGLVFTQSNFLPNDTTLGWDGTVGGKDVDVGVYVYAARVKFLDGEVLEYSGGVSLVR